MRRALVALSLAAAAVPAGAASRQKVAVLDVRSVQGVAPGTATILTAIIAGDTARAGFDVLSQADIGALIGFEKQKRMLGCGDDSSCLAEIGGALGAEFVLSTQVGQIGSRFHLSLQLLDARRGSVVARVSTFSETNEDALAATAERAVSEALAAARDRAATAQAKASAAPVKEVAAAPEAVATPIPQAAEPPAAAPPARAAPPATGAKPGSVAGQGFLASRKAYIELQVGSGPITTGMTEMGDSKAANPGFAVRAGVHWAPEWAFELGGGSQSVKGDGKGEYTLTAIDYDLDTQNELKIVFVSAGVAWAPRANRYFSLAGEVGVARAEFRHVVQRPSWWSFGDRNTESKLDASLPRIGAELRLDYPFRWVTVGLRAGVSFMKNTKSASASGDPTANGPQTTWLEAGWIVTTPLSLSLRYVF